MSKWWDRLSLSLTAFLFLCFFLGLASMGGCDVRPSPNPSDEVFCIDEDPETVPCEGFVCEPLRRYCCREFATGPADCWTE